MNTLRSLANEVTFSNALYGYVYLMPLNHSDFKT